MSRFVRRGLAAATVAALTAACAAHPTTPTGAPASGAPEPSTGDGEPGVGKDASTADPAGGGQDPGLDDAQAPDGCVVSFGVGALDASISGAGATGSQCLACGMNECPADWSQCEADCSCLTAFVALFGCFQDGGTIATCGPALLSADGVTQGFAGCVYGNCVGECLGGDGG